jgi:hypothetical protein
MGKMEVLTPIHKTKIRTQTISFDVEEDVIIRLNNLKKLAFDAGYLIDPTEQITRCLDFICTQAERDMELIEWPEDKNLDDLEKITALSKRLNYKN